MIKILKYLLSPEQYAWAEDNQNVVVGIIFATFALIIGVIYAIMQGRRKKIYSADVWLTAIGARTQDKKGKHYTVLYLTFDNGDVAPYNAAGYWPEDYYEGARIFFTQSESGIKTILRAVPCRKTSSPRKYY